MTDIPEENLDKDYQELIEIAMQILIFSGNAKNHFVEAMNYLSDKDYKRAEDEILLAKEEVKNGHKVQTETIQKESMGESIRYSTLFTHAQDTLMTTQSECLIGENLIKLFKSYEEGGEGDK